MVKYTGKKKKKKRMIKNRGGSRNEKTFVSVFRACKRYPDTVNYRGGGKNITEGYKTLFPFSNHCTGRWCGCGGGKGGEDGPGNF